MYLSMGNEICRRRKQLQMTQNDLAEKLGVTKQAVSKWENDLCFPDIAILPALAQLLGCSTDALFGVDTAITVSEEISQEAPAPAPAGKEPSVKSKCFLPFCIVLLIFCAAELFWLPSAKGAR